MMQKLLGIIGLVFSVALGGYALVGATLLVMPPNQDPPLPAGLVSKILTDAVWYGGVAVVMLVVSVLVLKSTTKSHGQTNAKI